MLPPVFLLYYVFTKLYIALTVVTTKHFALLLGSCLQYGKSLFFTACDLVTIKDYFVLFKGFLNVNNPLI